MPEPEPIQFAIPFRLGAGDEPVTVVQDSLDEIGDSVETLLRTPLGSLDELPEYGVDEQTFEEGGPDLIEIQTAIALWEDRADHLLASEPDLLDWFASRVNVNLNARPRG